MSCTASLSHIMTSAAPSATHTTIISRCLIVASSEMLGF
jgi:hypothetical protein